jgi:hypothetical protein
MKPQWALFMVLLTMVAGIEMALTAYADSKDPALRLAITKMVDHLPGTYRQDDMFRGFILKSLMACVRQTGYRPALDQAGKLVNLVFYEKPLFTPDNTFRHGGHRGP